MEEDYLNGVEDEYYFQKNRIVDPRRGKTIRDPPYKWDRINTDFAVHRSIDRRHGKTVTFMPITDADIEFGSGEVGFLSYGLDAKSFWLGAKERLEETAISKDVEKRYRHKVVTKYKVPVVGHIMLKHDAVPPKKPIKSLSAFEYQGQYLNNSYVHILHQYKIQQYKDHIYRGVYGNGTLIQNFNSKLADEDAKKYDRAIVKLPSKMRSATEKKKKNKTTGLKTNSNQQSGEIIIDLKYPTEVTHICMRSENPHVSFLEQESSPYIKLALIDKPENVSWVTAYDLFYTETTATGLKQWIKVNNFSANDSLLDLHITDLKDHYNTEGGLYTRYLKISPTNNRNKPVFNAAIYGKTLKSKMEAERALSKEQGETISVEVTESTGNKGVYDGKFCKRDQLYWYEDSDRPRSKKVKEFHSLLKFDDVLLASGNRYAGLVDQDGDEIEDLNEADDGDTNEADDGDTNEADDGDTNEADDGDDASNDSISDSGSEDFDDILSNKDDFTNSSSIDQPCSTEDGDSSWTNADFESCQINTDDNSDNNDCSDSSVEDEWVNINHEDL